MSIFNEFLVKIPPHGGILTFVLGYVKFWVEKSSSKQLEDVMSLSKDDIVTVTYTEGHFAGAQGQVVAVMRDKKKAKVKLCGKYLDDFDRNHADGVFTFDLGVLRVDQAWSFSCRVFMTFGDNFWYAHQLKMALDTSKLCMCKCGNQQTQSILVNIWGNIYERHVCDECAKQFHGHRMDVFPTRRPSEAAA